MEGKLKDKLFNKKEVGWKTLSEDEKNEVFEVSKKYIDFLNVSKTEREFVKNASLTPEPDTLVYFLKKKMKIEEVQVEMKEREFGKSYLTPIKSMKYMVNMIFSIVFIRAITRKK